MNRCVGMAWFSGGRLVLVLLHFVLPPCLSFFFPVQLCFLTLWVCGTDSNMVSCLLGLDGGANGGVDSFVLIFNHLG